MDYVIAIKANPIARKVKLADLTFNSDLSRLCNPTVEDYKRMEKFGKAMEILSSD